MIFQDVLLKVKLCKINNYSYKLLPDLTTAIAYLKIVLFLEREAKLMQYSKLEASTKALYRFSIHPVSIHQLWHNAINQTWKIA